MQSNCLQDVKVALYLLFLCFCMPSLIAGCKSIPPAEIPQAVINQESEKQVPQTSFSLSETKKLPDLPAVQLEENIEQSQPAKLYTLCVRGADVRDVLMSLGKESNISIIVDPDIDIEKELIEETEIKDLSRGEHEESVAGVRTGVRGGIYAAGTEGAGRDLGKQIQKRWTEKRRTRLVTADLKDVTLFEALDALLTPLRLEYKVEGNVVRVSKLQTITHLFHLNYIITRRGGERNMSVGITGTESRIGLTNFTQQEGPAGLATTRSVGGTNIFGLDAEDIFTEIETGLEGLGLISFGSGFGGVPEVEAEGGKFGIGTGREERFQRRREWQREWRVESGFAGWDGVFTINRQAGTILVTAFQDTILKVAEYLETVEGSVHRQVLIQAKVIEISLNKEFQYGINWNVIVRTFSGSPIEAPSPSVSGIFQATFRSRDFSAIIEALSEQGRVNVLSSPKISTLNNQKAIIKVGTEEVFFVTERDRSFILTSGLISEVTRPFYVSLGVTLDVTPQISDSGDIIMNIHPTVTEKLKDVTSPAGDVVAPNYTVREADTVIKARDGETVVIAGLMKDREKINEQKVPVLGNIPFLGWLFKNIKRTKEKTELVILLTPTVTVGEAIETVSTR